MTRKINFLQQGLLCGLVCERGFHIFDDSGPKVIEVIFPWSNQKLRLLLVKSPKGLTSVAVLINFLGNRCVLFLRYISTTACRVRNLLTASWKVNSLCATSVQFQIGLSPSTIWMLTILSLLWGEQWRWCNFFPFCYTSLLLRDIFILFVKQEV